MRYRCYNDNATLHFGVFAERYMLWRKVIASKSYRSGLKEAVIATHSYCSVNILAVIASKVYCFNSKTKVMTCNAVTFRSNVADLCKRAFIGRTILLSAHLISLSY